ncbi:MAG: hypothetical protein GEV03_05600 [Streptosporangiales bacterium]|nr:hypothetical protein [Streptosporangiales bacterium]
MHISGAELRRSGQKHIIGKVVYHCRRVVELHEMRMVLQRETPAGWRKVVGDTDNTIPPPSGRAREGRVVFPDCITGTWRMWVRAKTVYQGKRYRSPKVYSAPNYVDCEA